MTHATDATDACHAPSHRSTDTHGQAWPGKHSANLPGSNLGSARRICVQGDEARHEAAYQKIVEELIRRDADAAVLAFADMMQASIVMPAHLMQDGGAGIDAALGREEAAYGAAVARRAAAGGAHVQPHESDFFKGFAAVADGLGVYTAADYAACVEHLLRRWKVADLQVSTSFMEGGCETICCAWRVRPGAAVRGLLTVHPRAESQNHPINSRPCLLASGFRCHGSVGTQPCCAWWPTLITAHSAGRCSGHACSRCHTCMDCKLVRVSRTIFGVASGA